jgi:hypothetical protein
MRVVNFKINCSLQEERTHKGALRSELKDSSFRVGLDLPSLFEKKNVFERPRRRRSIMDDDGSSLLPCVYLYRWKCGATLTTYLSVSTRQLELAADTHHHHVVIDSKKEAPTANDDDVIHHCSVVGYWYRRHFLISSQRKRKCKE